jgi:hypothetical protein
MAREQLAMVAAEDGHGFAIDDEDVVSMTMTTSHRRPTFLQRARWDAVQKAKVQGMSMDGKGVGSPQRHRAKIHRCRKSADEAVAREPTGIHI